MNFAGAKAPLWSIFSDNFRAMEQPLRLKLLKN